MTNDALQDVHRHGELRSTKPNPAMAEVVNFAIALGRPLLVEGEPGSGKTTLARAIAHELELGEPRGRRSP